MFSKPHPYFVFRPDPLAGHGFERTVANGGDKPSGTRNISGFGNTCRRPAEFRAKLETHFSNDRQSSHLPPIQVIQGISCPVLHPPPRPPPKPGPDPPPPHPPAPPHLL